VRRPRSGAAPGPARVAGPIAARPPTAAPAIRGGTRDSKNHRGGIEVNGECSRFGCLASESLGLAEEARTVEYRRARQLFFRATGGRVDSRPERVEKKTRAALRGSVPDRGTRASDTALDGRAGGTDRETPEGRCSSAPPAGQGGPREFRAVGPSGGEMAAVQDSQFDQIASRWIVEASAVKRRGNAKKLSWAPIRPPKLE